MDTVPDNGEPFVHCTNPDCPWFNLALDASQVPGIPLGNIACGGCTLFTIALSPPGAVSEETIPGVEQSAG